jgi:hypothetical protein
MQVGGRFLEGGGSRIRTWVGFGADVLAPVLGPAPELARLLLDRYDEVLVRARRRDAA